MRAKLILYQKCSKLIEYKHTQRLVKSQKNNFNADTCFPVGAFFWTEDIGNGRVNYFDWRWAWIGQVDLFLTNIGPKMLHLGFKITFKVLGNEYLEETAVLARLSILSQGNFDL